MAEDRTPRKMFATGASRSTDADGVRYDLIPPNGLRRLAETYAEGAVKYGDGNWLKGLPVDDTLNHLIRHIELFRSGDRSEDHLAHASWGLFTLMYFQDYRPDLMESMMFCGAETPPAESAKTEQPPGYLSDEARKKALENIRSARPHKTKHGTANEKPASDY